MSTTDTLFLRISHISTWTGVHGADKRKTRRISTTHIDTIDRDFTVFEWLTERLEDMLIELEEFIEKKYSLMCQ